MPISVNFQYKKFNNLSLKEIHDLFLLRSKVFVVEQNCIYQDIDGKDEKAEHVLGRNNKNIIAYARILKDNTPNYISIGRILVSKNERGNSLGKKLLQFTLQKIQEKDPNMPIKISAQAHLERFYNKQGFKKKSDIYMEDGIPHISMTLE